MSFSVTTNLAAVTAHRHLANAKRVQARSFEQLSSGDRVNRASDDAAGLSIATGLRSQVNGYEVAQRNAADAIEFLQVAEGALGEIHALLQRMRELAVQAANDTNSPEAREALEAEFGELAKEVSRLHNTTNYNGQLMLHSEPTVFFQVGADGEADNTISVQLPRVTWAVLPVLVAMTGDLHVGLTDSAPGADDAHDNAQAAIEAVDEAINRIGEERSRMGAVQSRLERAATNATTAAFNLGTGESRLRDVDMAAEMARLNNANVLVQAGTAMLAQANVSAASILQLLR